MVSLAEEQGGGEVMVIDCNISPSVPGGLLCGYVAAMYRGGIPFGWYGETIRDLMLAGF